MENRQHVGHHVFVAGGTSGINLGIAEAFARSGARVAVMSRSQAKVNAAVDRIGRLGTEAWGSAGDVRDFAQVTRIIEAAADRFGIINVLVSGAAGNFAAASSEMSANAFKAVVDIDLIGTYNVLRAAYSALQKPGGLVINVSAPQSTLPIAMQSHACAAKAGVDMLTRVVALEWGPVGIRVNAVVPGPIEGTVGMERLAPTKHAHQLVKESVPLRRLGSVDDIANVCLMLASPLASYVSGAVLPVDGGWSLGGAGASLNAIASGYLGDPGKEADA